MFLSTPAKIFRLVLFFSMVFAGCSLWRSSEEPQVTSASQPKGDFPFPVREPEIFQAEIVVRTGENERRMFIARSGDRRRIDYDVGTDDRHGILTTDKDYLLSFKRMTYTERAVASGGPPQFEPLATNLLNLRDYSSFDDVGRDGNVVEYKVRINDSDASDISIFFDESIGLPVRQEFYSIEGDERKLQYSVELRDFRREVDESTFQIPPGFRRVSPEPLRRN